MGIWKLCRWHYIYPSHFRVLSLIHNCAFQVSAGHRTGLALFLCLFPMVCVEAYFNLWVGAQGPIKKASCASISQKWTKCQFSFELQLETCLSNNMVEQMPSGKKQGDTLEESSHSVPFWCIPFNPHSYRSETKSPACPGEPSHWLEQNASQVPSLTHSSHIAETLHTWTSVTHRWDVTKMLHFMRLISFNAAWQLRYSDGCKRNLRSITMSLYWAPPTPPLCGMLLHLKA